MASSISSMLNSRLRLTGMASGLDTESMIQQLMKVETARVDKVKQERQRLEWKRDDYREITNLLRGFKDDFFDILKPATNMRSASTYQKYTTVYGNATDSSIVTATGGAGVSSLTHTIKVTQLAAAATASSVAVLGAVNGGTSLSLDDTIGGTLKDPDVSDPDGTTVYQLKFGDKIVEYKNTDTIGQLISRVNSSDAGVTMSYSSFLNTFTITKKETGVDGNITITDTGDFLSDAKFTGTKDADDNWTVTLAGGANAEFTLDGKTVSSSDGYKNNTFNVDGITYTLNKAAPGTEVNITLAQDTDAIYNQIKDFVDKYNSILEKINSELGEKYYRDYVPLTDEQKSAMSESDIKLWEEKSKSGSLRNDGILTNMVTKMRTAVLSTMSGTLASIGISSTDYRDKGKLTIDETKLKAAIKNSPDKVISMFTQESSIEYSPDMSASDRKTRDAENGIVNRLYDILQDNIRTTRDANGKKGFLLEKAGIINDASEYSNTITKELDEQDKLINTLLEKLADKEDYYYQKFAAMETALSNMNSQSSWIAQQFGGG